MRRQLDMFSHDERRGAAISDCGRYRYWLVRHWGPSETCCVFILLNPSTADGLQDDPTVRRCVGFARDWGHDGILILNLFALRATDPKALREAEDPIGPLNDRYLRDEAKGAVVCGWGTHGSLHGRGQRVLELLGDRTLLCLGHNDDGTPKHPLYLPKGAPLNVYGGQP